MSPQIFFFLVRASNYLTAKSKKAVQLNVLPPTENAATELLMRVYLKIQLWLGREAKSEDLGWECKQNILRPNAMTKAATPEVLLKKLFCNKTHCAACSCKKSALHCTAARNCNSANCLNSPPIEDDEEEVKSNESLQMDVNFN